MPQHPTTSGEPNQSLYELIYSLRGLAQTVELYHKDLTNRIDEAARNNRQELDKLKDMIVKNHQVLSTLPITLSDRVEHLIGRLEKSFDRKIDGPLMDMRSALNDVHIKFNNFLASRGDRNSDGIPDLSEPMDKADITGRIELTKDGQVNVSLHSSAVQKFLKVAKVAIVVLATGGGVAGISQLFQNCGG